MVPDGSVLCVALGVGAPAALTRAIAERVRCGALKDLHLIYQQSLKPMAESFIQPDVLDKVDARMDVEHIASEYGCVNLRGRSTRERALALISIAHPNFRDELTAHTRRINLI